MWNHSIFAKNVSDVKKIPVCTYASIYVSIVDFPWSYPAFSYSMDKKCFTFNFAKTSLNFMKILTNPNPIELQRLHEKNPWPRVSSSKCPWNMTLCCLEPSCCKKLQKKSHQETGLGNRGQFKCSEWYQIDPKWLRG